MFCIYVEELKCIYIYIYITSLFAIIAHAPLCVCVCVCLLTVHIVVEYFHTNIFGIQGGLQFECEFLNSLD
jgi:hypothetical protein